MSMDVRFHGLSAFPLTPADEDGVVDVEALSRLIERLDAVEVDSIGLLGSTGSYAYLSRSERLRAVQAAAECVKGKGPLIVGVGALRTSDSVALAKDAEKAGADALLLAPISYAPLTQEEAYHHFAAVAGSTSLPLCIYNNPSTTQFVFGDELLVRLAYIPHIRAAKMPLLSDMAFRDELERLRPRLGEGFAIGYSGDWGASQAVLQGADCWYSVIGGLLPVPSLRLLRAAKAGDEAEVQRIEEYFQPMWALFKEFGSYRVVYAAANLLSLTHHQPPLPVMPLSVSDCARVEDALATLSELDGLPAATP